MKILIGISVMFEPKVTSKQLFQPGFRGPELLLFELEKLFGDLDPGIELDDLDRAPTFKVKQLAEVGTIHLTSEV